MAKSGKRRPWALEMNTSALAGKWFEIDAFDDQKLAEAHLIRAGESMLSGSIKTKFRVRNVVTGFIVDSAVEGTLDGDVGRLMSLIDKATEAVKAGDDTTALLLTQEALKTAERLPKRKPS